MRTIKTTTISILAIGLLAGTAIGVAAQDDETTSEAPTGSSFFTGTYERAEPTVEGSFSDADGVLQRRGEVLEESIDTSDPRVSGSVTRAVNVDIHELDDEAVFASTNAWRIENDGGTWTGSGTGLSHDGQSVSDDEFLNSDVILLTGEEGYSGLTAYLLLDWTQTPPAVTGAVFVGEAPPVPELPAE